jgi:hypothetical protein
MTNKSANFSEKQETEKCGRGKIGEKEMRCERRCGSWLCFLAFSAQTN